MLAESCAFGICVPAVIALIFVIIGSGQGSSELVGALGIVLSFVFGFAGPSLVLGANRRIRVGVVIPSREPFHQEIRRALYANLSDRNAEIIDLGMSPEAAREDLWQFGSQLRYVYEKRVDYIVMWASGVDVASQENVLDYTARLWKRGGLAIFLENAPIPMPTTASLSASIRYDGKAGAQILCDGLKKYLLSGNNKALILFAPAHLGPGKIRNDLIRPAFPESEKVRHIDLTSWSPDGALAQLRACIASGFVPDVIVCPNDQTALFLMDAIHSWEDLKILHDVKIAGFDGLPRAISVIAEKLGNLSLTVTVPLAEYGNRASEIILELSKLRLEPNKLRRELARSHVIPIDRRNLMTQDVAYRRLYTY